MTRGGGDTEYWRLLVQLRESSRVLAEALKSLSTWGGSNQLTLSSNGIDGEPLKTVSEQLKTVNEVRRKLLEDKVTIAFVGLTSAGKSALINTLVGHRVLPTSSGHCTPCCISVQSTQKPAPFLKRGADPKAMDVSKVMVYGDGLNAERSSDPLYVYLPAASVHSHGLRVDSVRLVDTPGLERDDFQNNLALVLKADAFVLVVDSDIGVDHCKMNQLLQDKHIFLAPAVFVVFSQCDVLRRESPQRVEDIKRQLGAEAATLLTADNAARRSREEVEDATFFLSSLDVDNMRQCDSLEDLEKTIGDDFDRLPASGRRLLVLGAHGVGKSILCNRLLGADLLPTFGAGTPRFVSFRAGPASSLCSLDAPERRLELAELQSLADSNEVSDEDTLHPVAVLLAPGAAGRACLLSGGAEVIDSPSFDKDAFAHHADFLEGAASFVVVVSAMASVADMEAQMRRSLASVLPCLTGDARGDGWTVCDAGAAPADRCVVYLVVNAWTTFLAREKDRERRERRRAQIVAKFVECTAPYQGDRGRARVFFMALCGVEAMSTALDDFRVFERRLFSVAESAHKHEKLDKMEAVLSDHAHAASRAALDLWRSLKAKEDDFTRLRASITVPADPQPPEDAKKSHAELARTFLDTVYLEGADEMALTVQGVDEAAPAVLGDDDLSDSAPLVGPGPGGRPADERGPPRDEKGLDAALDQFLRYCAGDPFGHVQRACERAADSLKADARCEPMARPLCEDAFRAALRSAASYRAFTDLLHTAGLSRARDLLLTEQFKKRAGIAAGIGAGGGLAAGVGLGAGIGAAVAAGAEVGAEVGAVTGLAGGPLGAVIGLGVGAGVGVLAGVAIGVGGGIAYHRRVDAKWRRQRFLDLLADLYASWRAEMELQGLRQLAILCRRARDDVQRARLDLQARVLALRRDCFDESHASFADLARALGLPGAAEDEDEAFCFANVNLAADDD